MNRRLLSIGLLTAFGALLAPAILRAQSHPRSSIALGETPADAGRAAARPDPPSPPRPLSGLHAVPIPEPGLRGGLDAIALVRSGNAWAVGAYQTASSDLTLAMHFNGRRWHVVFTPNPSAGWAHFFSVAGKGANDVWAVGTYAPTNAGWPNLAFRALAEHWDGSRWRVISTPNVGAAETLFGVAVLGPADAWAVGGSYNSKISFQNLQCEHTAHTLIEHWNGRAWRVVPGPDPGRSASFPQPCGPSHPRTTVNVLSGIAAVRPGDLWAVGHYWDGTANRTLVEHWNGRRWSLVPSPNSSAAENVLYVPAVASPRVVWAAGTYRPAPRAHDRTLIERWNGRVWRVVPSPNVPGQDNLLFGIAARGPDAWAVGRHDGSAGGPLAEHWDGTRWTIVPSQKVGRCACTNSLNGVAIGPLATWAAGEFIGANVHRSVIEAGRSLH